MIREEWGRLRPMLDAILDAPRDDRPKLLHAICPSDSDLRPQLERLLQLEPEADRTFDIGYWSAPASASGLIRAGSTLGDYRLLEEIGTGGMGTVYLSERADDSYRARVAVKIMRSSMASSDPERRFLQERQILAQLNHPGIAKLLDGGVCPDGRPYLVMEYVEGRPITTYCDENNLSIRERIALFRRVCNAVAAAHRMLVVHRDLKPDNILVNAEGHAKLLDFGIAKLVDPNSNVPNTVPLITPRYASPEQICGDSVATPADVYSLGALLYELLAGCTPHCTYDMPVHRAIRVILDTEPVLASNAAPETGSDIAFARRCSPRALSGMLKGDLDTILARALHKQVDRRYQTVDAFSADLDRYLSGLPVLARGDSFGYRVSKFLRRNAHWVAVAALVFCVVVASFVLVWRSRQIAQAEQQIAHRRFDIGQKLVRSYIYELVPEVESIPGSSRARALMAKRTSEYLDAMATDAHLDPALLRDLAKAYRIYGLSLDNMGEQAMGDRHGAQLAFDKAVSIARKAFALDRSDDNRMALIESLGQAGNIARMSGDLSAAFRDHKEACNLSQPYLEGRPTGRDPFVYAAAACWYLGRDYGPLPAYSGDREKALEYQVQTLKRFQSWISRHPEYRYGDSYLSLIEKDTGLAFAFAGRFREAHTHLERALAFINKIKNPDATDRSYHCMAELSFATVLNDEGVSREALFHAIRALEISNEEITSTRSDYNARIRWAEVSAQVGRAYFALGNARFGEKYIQPAIELEETFLKRDPGFGTLRDMLVRILRWTGEGELHAHRNHAARPYLQRAIELGQSAQKLQPDDSAPQEDVKAAHAELLAFRPVR